MTLRVPGAALKRVFDVVVAGTALLLLLPLLGLIAVAIRFTMGSPVLFRQVRPGLHGQLFTIVKFRTMRDTRDADGALLPDTARLTSFGRFLRSTSLDELPELWNVLRGDMSLVGPRPLLVVYLERYLPEQMRRHDVKPGLTGWAQVNGRNDLPWDVKLALDVWYVDNRSFRLDLKILFLTIWKILRREGINLRGFATTQEFRGAPSQARGGQESR